VPRGRNRLGSLTACVRCETGRGWGRIPPTQRRTDIAIEPKSNPEMIEKKERVDVLDGDGKTVRQMELTVLYFDDLTEEELDRREKEPGGMTTAEAIRYLRST
jgi:hypothetical protein